MKRTVCLMLAAVLLVSAMAGCAQTRNDDVKASAFLIEPTAKAETTAPMESPEPSPSVTEGLSPYDDLPTVGPPRNWDYEDGGLNGVGISIGNTNGNLRHGGLTVQNAEKTHVFYWVQEPDSFSDGDHILDYNMKDGTLTLVYEGRSAADDCPYLNYLDGKLWFTDGNTIYSYVSESKALMEVLEVEGGITSLHAAYGYLFISFKSSRLTLCFDIAAGKLTHRLDDFVVQSVMDGRLYQLCFDSYDVVRHISMTPDGRDVSVIESYESLLCSSSLAANGKLYWWTYSTIDPAFDPESGDIVIQDLESGETHILTHPSDFICYDLVNVSDEYVYVMDRFTDEWGAIYAIRVRDEKWMGKVSEYLYWYRDLHLLDGKFESKVIPYQRGFTAAELVEIFNRPM